MNKKSIKILFILIIAVIIIIVVNILLLIPIKEKNNSSINNVVEVGKIDNLDNTNEIELGSPENSPLNIEYKIKELGDENIFFSISDNIQNYADYITNNNSKAVYNLLDRTYIEQYGITESNVLGKVSSFAKKDIELKQIYYIETDFNKKIYFVFGNLVPNELKINTSNSTKENFRLIMNYDGGNLTFSVAPYASIYKDNFNYNNNTITIKDKKLLAQINDIEKNENNKFISIKNFSKEDLVRKYLSLYKQAELYYPKEAYKLLDKEYKKKRFNNDYAEFTEYLRLNKSLIQSSVLSQYMTTKENKKTVYTCLDSNGNYYIIEENKLMDFTVKLDNYTIKDEQTRNSYLKTSDEKKAKINLDLFVQMLNQKDYRTIFNHFDKTFRNKNFNSVDKLKKYIQENFFTYTHIASNKITLNKDVYVCELEMSNGIGSIAEFKSLTVIIKLENNNDFTMSFSF